MAQHDMNLINAAGAAFRSDMNNALLALITNSSGATEPATTYSYQWWADTTAGLLKLRNAANTDWITIGSLSAANLGLAPLAGATFTGALLAAVGLVGTPGVAFAGDPDTGFYWVSANTWGLVSGGVEYARISSAGITFLGTGATSFPSGTTAQRPGSPVNGMIRYNSDLLSLDVYINGGWATIPGVAAYPFLTSDLANTVELVAMPTFDFNNNQTNTPIYPQFPWSAPAKLSNPSTLPASDGSAIAQTMNGEFVCVGHASSPYMSIYHKLMTGFLKLSNPSSLPASQVVDAAFSSSGEFLAVATASSPYIQIYQRAAGTTAYVKLSDPSSLPAGAATGVAWSPNDEFLSVTHGTTPFVTIYQRTAATTFTKLSNPASLPAAQGNGVAWSPDGRFMTVAHNSSPYITIYERSAGTTFTKLSDPADLPASAGLGVAFSVNGLYMAVVHATSPYATLYSRSGTTFTKMIAGNSSQFSDSADYPAGQGNRCQFSLDSSYLAIAHNSSPYMSNYLLTSGKWVKQANPSTPPTGNGTGVSWASNREFLYVSHTTTPFMTLYQTASDFGASNPLILKKILRAGV